MSIERLIGGLTIKASLVGVTVILVATLLGLGGKMAIDAVWNARTADATVETNAIGDHLLGAATNLAVERGVTFAALSATSAVDANKAAIIEERRGKARTALDAALEGLRRTEFAGKAETIAAIERNRAKANRLRQAAERDLAMARHRRDPGLLKTWVPAMTALIESSQAARRALDYGANDTKARMARLQQFKDAVWVMAEYAGRERAVVGGLIAAGEPMDAAKLKTLAGFRGHVEEAWATVQAIARTNTAGPAVVAAVEAVERDYFTDFQKTREAVYQAGAAERAYPIAENEWITRATNAIDTIAELASTTGRVVEATADGMSASAQRTVMMSAAVVVLGLLFAVAALWIVVRRVAAPIRSMTDSMTALAKGDTSIEVPAQDRRDEIGAMAKAVQVFKDEMAEAERLRKEQEEAEQRAQEERRKAMHELADTFESQAGETLKTVASAAVQLKTNAESMASVAEQGEQQSSAVAAASEEASSNVQTVASAAEQLSSSIAEISRQVTQSTEITARAVSEAESTGTTVQGLAEAAGKIGEVVKLISDIAEQTNLLALNATIEAARAGEAGKGFAVVASEVKELANQTAKATEEISQQINSVQAETQDAVAAIERIQGVIGEVNEIASSIASAVEQQEAATSEITRNVQEAAGGTEQVSSNIGGVSEGAQQTRSAANDVLSASSQLSESSDTLQGVVEKFLSEVRAA